MRPVSLSQTHLSVPPVVSSSDFLPAESPTAPATSSGKAVLVGAAFGLCIVAALVVFFRFTQGTKAHTASESSSSAPVALVQPPRAAAAPAEPPTPATSTPAPSPEPAVAKPLPVAAPTASTPAAAAQAPAAAPARPVAVVASKPAATPAQSATAAAAPSAKASASSDEEAAPDDSASLVPVLPPSQPVQGDPLIRAVHQDIQEEEAQSKPKRK
jgi:hypothetical protein